MTLEPSAAVEMFETSLRSAIREVLPGWQASLTPEQVERLRGKQSEDAKRRDGAVISADLLNYTETTQLTTLVEKNWENFKPIFQDLARLKVSFGLLLDYRNPAQHNRELLPHERELLSGSAQQLRNQVALYRGTGGSKTRYYPVIEFTSDHLGQQPVMPVDRVMLKTADPRLEVSEVIEVRVRALPARGFDTEWWVATGRSYGPLLNDSHTTGSPLAVGEDVVLRYEVQRDDVAEDFVLAVVMRSTSRHHRRDSYDDSAFFYYAVNPPEDE